MDRQPSINVYSKMTISVCSVLALVKQNYLKNGKTQRDPKNEFLRQWARSHNYINAISDDLDMKYAGGFSAAVYDLPEEKERKRLSLFVEHFFDTIENNVPRPRNFRPLIHSSFEYVPGGVQGKVCVGSQKVVIRTDSRDEGTNIGRMVRPFIGTFSGEVEVIDLNEVDIR